MLDISKIEKQWSLDEPKIKKLGEQVEIFIKKGLHSMELHPEVSHRTKEIQSIIKKIQKKQKEKQYEYNDLRDKLGVRIICSFLNELDLVDYFLKENFLIRKEERKKEKIDFNKLDYQSNHYDISVKKELIDFDEDFVFEIQVRTINQHIWASSAHVLYYKQEIYLPDEMKHRIFRLQAFYELADEEFQRVNDYLKSQKNNLVYTLLRKLEGKLYKYAETDFDRDTSIENLTNILKFYTLEEQNKLDFEIETFLEENDEKIKHIYNDNRDRYAKLPLLTQPEIFVVWYGLEKYLFSVTDNWDKYFDESDLEQIKTMWGCKI